MPRSAAARAAPIVELPEFDEAAAFATAVDATSVALMFIDRDFTITTINHATRELFSKNAEIFRRAYPTLDINNLVGVCIDVLHKNPAHQRRMLAQPLRETHHAEITIGDLRFSLRVNSIIDAHGEYVGNVLEWADVTEKRTQEGMLAAISRSQAVIEFSIDGHILDANENFLATLGYSLSEIKGKHHSLFVDPLERNTSEYRLFWDRLARGEFDVGKYRRIGKDGRTIWIQATYNPVLDRNGKAFKVVKYAVNVSEQQAIAERVKQISSIVASAATEMQHTAADMSQAADVSTEQAASVAVAAQAASMNVQTVAAAGEELSASIGEIARQVTESSLISQQAVAETDRTGVLIQTLADAAQKIGNVVTLINNIAGQTKLLALNATIEAARAGDAGKGFAVVASEVKSLSDQTAKATHEISSQVAAMQAATTTSVQAIQGISETIKKVAEIASAIASAVEEQSAATREISANVAEAAAGTQQVSASIGSVSETAAQTNQAAGELLSASGELSTQAEMLSAEMERLLAA
jgi:methyl-accepting chemotaxis protein